MDGIRPYSRMDPNQIIDNIELRITEDGSHTLFVLKLNEHYHSIHGAITESMHVYINNGLMPILKYKNNISILEIGFGTGLNAFLTYQKAKINNATINYFAIEKYPLPKNIYNQLNYPQCINIDANIFYKMHQTPANISIPINENFYLTKYNSDFTNNQQVYQQKYDLVYFDAFAPNKQKIMWQSDFFLNYLNVSTLMVFWQLTQQRAH